MEIFVKYHVAELMRLEQIAIGNWIDLRCAEETELKAGEFRLINLGVSIKLPDGYEAWVAPRSSTFKTWGILMANSIGVVDNAYSGTNDVWRFPALAMRDTLLHVNDRICQFRIMPVMPKITFTEREMLDDIDRGGFGSTGTN